ncbi:hypothetical protein ODZ84_21935 [Chryseobacterium fluminis]|uniref:hypothetical protein n=1 Tax=Chryseobacterium fluminis TaxID=2983606 RepID=UPI00225070D0|nr:hypothetical protein [Chryseobacterium sp. MMS21-Ot14]UZT97799.1 hypothetical protein ODZ84_21935 [Chryseobacterium sp. MMS21-Ot14]
MKKKFKITSNLEQKEILKKSIQNSENENVDLYKSIFGGINNLGLVPGTGGGGGVIIAPPGGSCDVVAISGASAAYDRHDTFLRA